MARWLSWLVVLAVACNGSDTVVLEERGPVVLEAGAPEGSAGLADVGPRTPQDARWSLLAAGELPGHWRPS